MCECFKPDLKSRVTGFEAASREVIANGRENFKKQVRVLKR